MLVDGDHAGVHGIMTTLTRRTLQGLGRFFIVWTVLGAVFAAPAMAQVNLAVTTSDNPDPVVVNQPVDYDITLQNLGSSPATQISVSVFPSAGLTYMPTPTPGWTCSLAAGIVCNPQLSSLSGGQSAPLLRLRFTAPSSAQTVQISVTADSAESDINPANNTNIVQTTNVVQPNADLTLQLTSNPPSATVGAPVKFTANIANAGPAAAPGLTMSGTLSGPFTFSSFTVSMAWSCSHSTGNISCIYQGGSPSGTLASGLGAPPIEINGVAGPGVGTAVASLTATSVRIDPTPANASASILVTAGAPASVDLSINKSVVGSQPIPRGVPFVFRLQVSNLSGAGQSASMIQVTDSLPSGVVFQSASGAGWSCTGAVVCNYAPTLTPGQSASPLDLTVVYNQNVPGGGTSVLNTASVSSAETDSSPSNNQSSAAVMIRGSADLSAQITGPGTVSSGASFSLNLIAGNAGPDEARNISITGTVASSFSVGAVIGGSGWSCLASGQSVTCTRPSLTLGSSTAATLNLTAPNSAGGPFTNSATISAESFDPSVANNSSSSAVTVTAAVLTRTLIKTDSMDPVPNGTAFEYTLTVTNTGNAAQTNIVIVDNLPSILRYQSFSGSSWVCVAPSSLGATVSCNFNGALGAGTSSSVRLTVRPEGVGSITNQAQVTSAENSVPTNASQGTVITESATLGFSKFVRATPVALGINAFFDIVVDNSSQSDFSGLVVVDDLPAGLQAVSASGQGWTCTTAGSRFDCRRSLLPRLTRSTIVIEARTTTVGTFINRAQLTHISNSTVQTASDSVVVIDARGRADLAIDKSDSIDPVPVGDEFEYRLRVSNLGPDTANEVRVTDTLPASVQLVSATGPGWDCTLGSTVVCQLQTGLTANNSSTVFVRVRAPASGTINNTATVIAAEIDPVSINNTDSETTVVQGTPQALADLSVVPSGPTSVVAGSAVPIVARVANSGPSAAASVVLRASPTGPWTITGGSGAGFSCAALGSGVECRATSLAPGSSQDISFNGQSTGTTAGTLGVEFALASTTADPVLVNNSANLSIIVTPLTIPPTFADLLITKTDSIDPVVITERFTYTVTVRNLGPAVASNVVIRDPLPAGLVFVSAAGAGLTCTGGANVICNASASLAAGQQISALITVDAGSDTASITNTATVTSSTTDPTVSNNSAQQTTQIVRPEGTDAEELLTPSVGGDTLAGEAVTPVVNLCAGATGTISSLCNALFSDAADGRDEAVRDTLRALYPEEVLSQFASLNQLASTQFFNLDARMAELRAGTGGFSMAGLTATLGSQSVPLGLLSGLYQNEEPEIGGPGDLISPWGYFVNGSFTRGDQNINPQEREVVVDFDSVGVTAGVDYRASTRWIVGAALGYNRFTSNLTDFGDLETTGITLTGFNSFSITDRVYWDTRLSYGRIQLDQSRRLRIALTDFVLDETLLSDTDASQMTFASTIGYSWNRGAWTVTPSGFIRYVRSDVDGFTESDSDFAVRYADQEVTSKILGVGLQVSRAISLSKGVLVPQFDLTWNHEAGNDDTVIEAGFVNGNGDFFQLRPDSPDRSYGDIGFGLVYIMANGRQAFLQWRQSVGVDGLDRSTVNLGARFEF